MHNTTQIAYTISGGTYTLTKGENEMENIILKGLLEYGFSKDQAIELLSKKRLDTPHATYIVSKKWEVRKLDPMPSRLKITIE